MGTFPAVANSIFVEPHRYKVAEAGPSTANDVPYFVQREPCMPPIGLVIDEACVPQACRTEEP